MLTRIQTGSTSRGSASRGKAVCLKRSLPPEGSASGEGSRHWGTGVCIQRERGLPTPSTDI